MRNVGLGRHAGWKLPNDESGQDLLEYSLVVAVIALGVTSAVANIATTSNRAFVVIGALLFGSASAIAESKDESGPRGDL